MPMDDLKNKKRLGQMMTESLSPEDSALNAPEAPSEEKSMYQEYLKPLIEEKMRQKREQFQHENQVSKDNSAIMHDKFKMAMNPNLQGPPQPGIFDERLPAEKETQEKYMQMALGTMGGSPSGAGSNLPFHLRAAAQKAEQLAAGVGKRSAAEANAIGEGVKPAQSIIDKITALRNKASSKESMLKALEEQPGIVATRDPQQLEAASQELTKISPSLSPEQRQLALQKLNMAIERAKKFNP